MKLARPLLAAAVLCSSVTLPSAIASAQTRERVVYASVVDNNDNPVEGLNASSFVIREDDVAREVLRVLPATEPMQIALLVDNSAAVASAITPLRQALTRFVTVLTEPIEGGGMNELAVITLADRPTIAANYTTSREVLLKAVNSIFPQSASAAYLLDGIVETSQGLVRRGATRPVLVTVTTEGPDYSSRNRQQALAALDRMGGIYDAIILGPAANDLSDEGRDRAIVLAQGSADHGGRQDILLTSMALPDRLDQLARELRSQYRIVYARPDTLIPPNSVTVSTTDPKLKAYGAPAADANNEERR
jgi:hypothetical protein